MIDEQFGLNEFYLLGLMVGSTGDHLATSYSYKELTEDTLTPRQARQSLDRLVHWGLATNDNLKMADTRKSNRLITLTPRGLAFALQNEATILKAMMDGGSVEHLSATKEAFDNLSAIGFIDTEIEEIVEAQGINRSEINRIETMMAVASDRLVPIDHNRPEAQNAIEEIDKSLAAISDSNFLDIEEKSFLTKHIKSGISLLKSAGNVVLGAIKFLLIDRLKEAYKSGMEEALKLVIKGAIVSIFLWIIGIL